MGMNDPIITLLTTYSFHHKMHDSKPTDYVVEWKFGSGHRQNKKIITASRARTVAA